MMSKKFKLIVGLGNPGDKYKLSRHNVGFLILDNYLTSRGKFEFNKKFEAEIFKTGEIIFAKPQTYMNLSGKSVAEISRFYQIAPSEILVIQDELDLDFGKVKLSFDSSDAGHNGIKDITKALGTQAFYRIRYGIGKPADYTKVEDYVLQNFTVLEQKELENFNLDSYLN
jgi:PTH1 family peptidyl-tRNA hydrolase